MANVAIHKADELTPATKAVVEAELGRPLRGDEEVSIMAFTPHEAPEGEARREAVGHLQEHLKRIDQITASIPSQEMEDILSEAIRNARPSCRERT